MYLVHIHDREFQHEPLTDTQMWQYCMYHEFQRKKLLQIRTKTKQKAQNKLKTHRSKWCPYEFNPVKSRVMIPILVLYQISEKAWTTFKTHFYACQK